MMTTLFFTVAFIIVALFVYMARYSGRLRVEEKRLIAAPLAEVYAKVADFRAWNQWGPWLEHEPEASVQLSGAPDGKGGSYSWDGSRIGTGSVEHRELRPLTGIRQVFRSRHPFSFRGKSYWRFAEQGGQTEVTWGMRGRVGFSFRAFSQTVQGVIALDYRFGLDKLARLLEAPDSAAAAMHYSLEYLGVRDVAARRYASHTYEGSLKGLAQAVREGNEVLHRQLAEAGIPAAGNPLAVYVRTNIKLRTTVCHLGIPIGEAAAGKLTVREIPAHRAYVVRLTGTYSALEVAWYQAMQRMRMDGLRPDQRIPPFECYLNDPEAVAEPQWLTELHLPVQEGVAPR